MNKWKWIPAIIKEARGRVMYNVHTSYGRIYKIHANQMHIRAEDEARKEQSANQIPFNLLCEEFELRTPSTPVPVMPTLSPTAVLRKLALPATSTNKPIVAEDQPRRTSSRVRRPPKRYRDYVSFPAIKPASKKVGIAPRHAHHLAEATELRKTRDRRTQREGGSDNTFVNEIKKKV